MPSTMQGMVGVSIPRVDATAKVTGATRFIDDLAMPAAWHGRTIRSAVAHGILRDIRLDAAYDWTNIVVVTAGDIPGRNVVLLDADDQPCLVAIGDRIRHAAQAIALVAAPTREQAIAAAAHVEPIVDALPPVLTVDEALLDETVVAVGDTNVLRDLSIGHGDVDAAFAAADVVVEGVYRTGPAEHGYLEPQGVAAWWGPGGMLHVVGSLQCPYYVHRALLEIFALPTLSLDVTQAPTGGGFGGKEDYPSMLAAHVALLARSSGHPVKMIYDRSEDIAATTKRHPSVIRHRLAATSDGQLLAADVDVVLDAGAYITVSPVVLLRSMLHATGAYRIPAVRVRGRAVATNHPPSGAFRGFGAPQSIFAAERQMSKLCTRLGADQLQLRRANMLQPGDTTPTGGRLDASAALGPVLDALEARLATPAPQPHAAAAPARGAATGEPLRGRGVALAFHGAGFTGNGETVMHARATVALAADGTFQVLTSCVDMGQGARTVLAQLAADALGVALEQVDVPEPSTMLVPDTGPTVASRTTMVAGSVVVGAATRLRDRLLEWGAAHSFAAGDLAACARAAAAAGNLPAVTEQYEPVAEVVWDQATLTGDAYPTYSWSATAVDVAVDECTSEVTVERCIQVIDAGRAINPMAVEGQVHGGTLQALGWALLEHVERPGGAVAAPSFSTAIIPTALDAPELEALFVEVPFSGGPAGAKGIGELPMDGPAPAVASAVSAALGCEVDELPLLPEVLHRLRRRTATRGG